MKRKEKAVEAYRNGYNCAQSIITAFEDKLKHKKDILIEMATGFGGGMGRLQQTCGAVTGAIMVLSLLNKNNAPDSKEKLNENIQEFASRFDKEYGSLNCQSLIPYNLSTEDGRNKAREEGIFENQCTQYVAKAVELVEEILNESNKS